MNYQQLKKIVAFYTRFTASYTQVGYRWRSLSWKKFTPDYRGQHWLVTGASGGIGRYITLAAARAGATVTAVARSEPKLARLRADAAQEGIAGLDTECCDFTLQSDTGRLIERLVAGGRRIDVLVNNVGGSAKGGPVEMSEEVFDAQVAHNLKSVFLTCKHVLPVMVANGGGSIVNLSSTSGLRWTGSAQVAYAATKAGVIQLSRVLAVEYAGRGVRVNTVVPGQLHTPMVEARLAGQRAGGDVQALLQQRQSRIPLPFMGDGRDTAAAALFLASDEARFITGTEIVVDGGMTARCD